MTGRTTSPNFPQTSVLPGGGPGGDADAFVTKIAASGSSWVYSICLGGAGYDAGTEIKVDTSGNAFVAGDTMSPDFPTTPGALQPKWGSKRDVFVAKLNSAATGLLFSTYLGGAGEDVSAGLNLGSAGEVYVAGWTSSSSFPTTGGAYQTKLRGEFDGFVSKLNPEAGTLLYSTLLGGSANDALYASAVDSSGAVWLTGAAESADFPTTSDAPRTPLQGPADAVLVKLDPTGSALAYAALLGGSKYDDGLGIVLDTAGNVYAVVESESADFPVSPGAYRTQYAGGETDVVIVKLTTEEVSHPAVPSNGVVNAASSLLGPVAPGEIVTIYGARLGPGALELYRVTPEGIFDSTLAGTRVLIDGVAAPLVYTSAGQVSAIVPYRLAGKSSVELVAEYRGLRSSPVSLAVAPAAPGIFTLDQSGKNQGAILNQDYSVNGPSNPAARGSVVMVYATGEGQTNPAGVDGKIGVAPLPAPVLGVTASVGGQDAEVLYAGAAPGLVAGVFQVNVRIPAGVTPGNAVSILVKVGDAQSQAGVTLAVQ